MIKYLSTTLVLFLSVYAYSYNYLPVVKSFHKEIYSAGRQNWDIGTDSKGIVYFGNNDGLLRYIFGQWELSKTENDDAVRSLCVFNDTIWCAGILNYGYFVKDSPGNMTYHKIGNVTTGIVWNIECYKNYVYYQNQDGILAYNKHHQKVEYIKIAKGIWGIVNWNNSIWVLDKEGQLGVLNDTEFNVVTKCNELSQGEVRKLFIHDGLLYILVFDGRLFKYNGQELIAVELPRNISNNAFFTGCTYKNDALFIGTVAEGLMRVDLANNTAEAYVDRENGLLDNTILAIGKDINGNLWLGLDYGIAFVEVKNPIKYLFKGGATYSILDDQGSTLLATNKGLFASKGIEPFSAIDGSYGQVWRLRKIQQQVFVCHNKGVYDFKNNKLVPLYTETGVMDVARFENTPYYLLSAYSGLLLVKYENQRFMVLEHLDIWGDPKIAYDKNNDCIWVASKFSDLIAMKINEQGTVSRQTFSRIKTFFKGHHRFVFYDDEVLLEFEKETFVPIPEKPFVDIRGRNITAFDVDKNSNFIAYVQNGYPNLLANLMDGNFYSYQKILSSFKNSLLEGYEFVQLYQNEMRIATEQGVMVFNINTGSLAPLTKSVISKLEVSDDSLMNTYTYPFVRESIELGKGDKSLIFYLGTNKSSSDLAEFRYRLSPYETNWSQWSSNRKIKEYSQIKGGNYEFQFQTKFNGGELIEDSLKVNIEKFWYQTYWVWLPVLLLIFLLILFTIRIMHMLGEIKLKRQQKLNKERIANQTIALKNEQLLQYTEVISSKNEFLNELKDGLSRMRNAEAKQWENRIVDEVNKEKKNFLFHKLFSELHQDFINRLTETHQNLTSNDIRVLSFIRINLGTKEIANLMNISPKSVDITRYRLRKKLALTHEEDLNKYVREL